MSQVVVNAMVMLVMMVVMLSVLINVITNVLRKVITEKPPTKPKPQPQPSKPSPQPQPSKPSQPQPSTEPVWHADFGGYGYVKITRAVYYKDAKRLEVTYDCVCKGGATKYELDLCNPSTGMCIVLGDIHCNVASMIISYIDLDHYKSQGYNVLRIWLYAPGPYSYQDRSVDEVVTYV